MPKIWSFFVNQSFIWVNKILDLLAPEDIRIERLLSQNFEKVRDLLPESKVSLSNVNVLFDYQSRTVKSLIHLLKFKNNMRVRKFFALCLSDTLTSLSSDMMLFENRRAIIVPVPMSKNELRGRGFNQMEELLSEVNKISGGNLNIRYDILEKIRETPRQTHLGREERNKNICNSMRIKRGAEDQAKDQIFIVVDDVYTTGATFDETRRALSAACKDCIGVFLAH